MIFVGCLDSFFGVCGYVRHCSSNEPIVGVKVSLNLVEGISSEELVASYTNPDGYFCVYLNEPPNVTVTLSTEKPFYKEVEENFDGSPEDEVNLCLEPEAE